MKTFNALCKKKAIAFPKKSNHENLHLGLSLVRDVMGSSTCCCSCWPSSTTLLLMSRFSIFSFIFSFSCFFDFLLEVFLSSSLSFVLLR
ncbi:unnamed protein product [Haemonchus placei]|uniref:Ovule protein n=1 Tax=Haemonchus placei TaxID=6290 RepID=A0A0N4W2H8_HAEPC|nr:unnamed protein product [Haemonchus placei]